MSANAPSTTSGVPSSRGPDGRLNSWKEIAAYINVDVKTAQRYEKSSGLPVYRHEQTGRIYAFKFELDSWIDSPIPKKNDAVKDDQPQPEPPQPDPRPWGLWIKSASIGFAVLVAIVFAIKSTPSRTSINSVHAPARLVVVPFENVSADQSLNYLARGISDDLIAAFGKLQSRNLIVVERVTAALYETKPVEDIARDLHADYVLKGKVWPASELVHMNVHLFRVKDQSQSWSNTYEDTVQNLWSRPPEIAARVEGTVRGDLQKETSSRVDQVLNYVTAPFSGSPTQPSSTQFGTRNPKAYDNYLHGLYFWNRRGVESMAKSVQYFQAAIADDPDFAAAYAGLADGLALMGSAQFGAIPPNQAFPKAKSAAEKALGIDNRLAQAHAALAYISLVYDRDLPKARHEFEEAIRLDPSYPTARQWFGLYYEVLGDTNRAIETVNEAKQQDSLNLAVNIALAESYYLARDYDHALDQANAAVELDPGAALAHFNRGRVYLQKKQYAEALKDFEAARANAPYPATLIPLGYTYGRMNNPERAKFYLRQLDEAAKTQYVPAIYHALIYAGLNDKENAFLWLNKAFDEHCDYLVFLEHDPIADPLRDDPRFADLLKRIESTIRR
ncbi:MAG TPA: tetratricopeptide repeat protein [Terriglobales bacterium]|nr:tetratricopeptide repeat protein [Terriglobales bacterium]